MQAELHRNESRRMTKTVSGKRTQNLVYCALFTTLIAIGAFIKIPVPVVPFTLQFLFTMMAGLLLGGRLGAVSVITYMLLGLVGLPVFAEGGGIWYIAKPSFGYIIGFVMGTYVTGKIVEKMKELVVWKIMIANLVGLLIVYAVGMLYFYIVSALLGTPIGVWPLIKYCFLLAVPGDLCLCILAAFLAKRLCPIFAGWR